MANAQIIGVRTVIVPFHIEGCLLVSLQIIYGIFNALFRRM